MKILLVEDSPGDIRLTLEAFSEETTVSNRESRTLMPTNSCFAILPYLELLSPVASGIHRTDP